VPEFWSGSDDSVAAVDPADLRNVLQLFRDFQTRNPGECGSIDSRVFDSVGSSGADVMAVWYRASMLGVLQMLSESPLTPWTHEDEFDDLVFQVAA